MLKQIKSMFNSIKFTEDYIQESQLKTKNLDERFHKILIASLNGPQPWFLELAKKDPNCVIDILKECDIDESK